MPSPRFARFASSASGGAKKRSGQVDTRAEIARRIVFETPPSPTLKLDEEAQIQHETIHRAWLLYKRKERLARQRQLESQHGQMKFACEELKRVAPTIYRQSMLGTEEEKYFPRRFAIPVDTFGTNGWDHDWKGESNEDK